MFNRKKMNYFPVKTGRNRMFWGRLKISGFEGFRRGRVLGHCRGRESGLWGESNLIRGYVFQPEALHPISCSISVRGLSDLLPATEQFVVQLTIVAGKHNHTFQIV